MKEADIFAAHPELNGERQCAQIRQALCSEQSPVPFYHLKLTFTCDEFVPVAPDHFLTMLPNQVNGLIGIRPFAHKVSQADNPADLTLLNIRQNGLQCCYIAMNI
ncbi:hypothetical protein D3C75_1111470 [compost metagenome]